MHGVSGDTTPGMLSPTISSIASDLSLEDIVTMHAHDGAPNVSSDATVKKHPMHFMENNMVEIRVRDTLFRVPLNYLTDNSRYFARLVEESPMATESLCIYDDDVVVEAFAHLVHAIRTPGGTPPDETDFMCYWTNVLHLSSKWEISSLRTTAIQAIWPRASSVDKIALGRAYEIPDWLPEALNDVHTRQDNLTIEEARRLPLEDVVDIGRCRQEVARTTAATPRKPRNKIGRFLIHLGLLLLALSVALFCWDRDLVNETIQRVSSHSALIHVRQTTNSSLNHMPDIDTVNIGGNKTTEKIIMVATDEHKQRDRKRITRWLDQRQDKSVKFKSAETSLVSVIQATPSKGPVVLEVLLSKGRRIFAQVYEKNEQFQAKPNGRPEYPDIAQFQRQVVEPLWQLHSASGHQLLHAPETEAFLVVTGHWEAISTLPVHLDPFQVWNHLQFKSIIIKTVYVSYLIHKFPELADLKIYQTLWTRLTDALLSYTGEHATTGARTLQRFLDLTATFVSTNKASIEMDGFYELAERLRDEAGEAGSHDMVQILKEILEQRVWPKD